MTAISVLESRINDFELQIASIQDDIKNIEARIEEYTGRRIRKMEILNNLDEDTVELNEAIHILKGG